MPLDPVYHEEEPTRDEIDQTTGPLLLEFGANWCGHCQALSPVVESMLAKHPDVRHIRIADGRGKRLGRSFRVKLWPTLVYLRDGQLVSQLARPSGSEAQQAMQELLQGDGSASDGSAETA